MQRITMLPMPLLLGTEKEQERKRMWGARDCPFLFCSQYLDGLLAKEPGNRLQMLEIDSSRQAWSPVRLSSYWISLSKVPEWAPTAIDMTNQDLSSEPEWPGLSFAFFNTLSAKMIWSKEFGHDEVKKVYMPVLGIFWNVSRQWSGY